MFHGMVVARATALMMTSFLFCYLATLLAKWFFVASADATATASFLGCQSFGLSPPAGCIIRWGRCKGKFFFVEKFHLKVLVPKTILTQRTTSNVDHRVPRHLDYPSIF